LQYAGDRNRARASELLAERWSIIILRSIVILGCRTFNEIADGAPELSRGHRRTQVLCGPPGDVRRRVPQGRHYYWKAWRLPPLTDAAIDVIIQQAAAISSPLSAIPIFTLGGTVGRIDEDATAFSGRSAAHDINFVAAWLPEDARADEHKAWRTAWDAMRPSATGVYSNFRSDEPAAHVRVACGEHKYDRLAELKNKYDPNNVFRFNHNIARVK
jgi:hypothetical protein